MTETVNTQLLTMYGSALACTHYRQQSGYLTPDMLNSKLRQLEASLSQKVQANLLSKELSAFVDFDLDQDENYEITIKLAWFNECSDKIGVTRKFRDKDLLHGLQQTQQRISEMIGAVL